MMLDRFTLSLCVGIIAGLLVVIPMFMQRSSGRSCIAFFLIYLFASVIIFYSNLPRLPWWADGMAVTLMMTLPMVLGSTGKDNRSVPLMLLNAVLLGFLISVAEYLYEHHF